MKKINFLHIVFCFLLLFTTSSCNSRNNPSTNDFAKTTNNIEKTEISKTENTETSLFSDIGGGNISTRKYRVNYYDVPYQFVLLVGEDAFWEWDENYNTEDPDETNIMVMKKFIQYFNISREDFDKANLNWTKTIQNEMGGKPIMNPKDFANQETDESYNADILYTFDDQIINDYYLSGYYPFIFETDYEQAVADGTYETRTTDWIDIEQMEAEIIAKYGETEIVHETATVPEEPAA